MNEPNTKLLIQPHNHVHRKMQDPNLDHRTFHSSTVVTTTTTTTTSSSSPSTMLIMKGGGHHHRRAHSEMSFRLSDDMTMMMMMMHHSDPVNGGGGGGSSTASIEEIGSEDDLFSTYIDVDKFTGEENNINNNNDARNCTDMDDHNQNLGGVRNAAKTATTRRRHSNSMDGSFVFGCGGGEIMEAKKVMPPDKLAELWTVDPKRAKRILANRQSAARSKERKARYIVELEHKVQTLQTEATSLSAQLTLFQRDTNGLSIENTELKLRLQSMEQQGQLRYVLNETLKKEVERLKMATGEMISPSDTFNLGMHHNMPSYTQSNFYPVSQQQAGSQHNMPLPLPFSHSPFHQIYSLPDYMQNDPLGRLQGLDIGSKGLSIVKSEGPSLSASDQSSSNF